MRGSNELQYKYVCTVLRLNNNYYWYMWLLRYKYNVRKYVSWVSTILLWALLLLIQSLDNINVDLTAYIKRRLLVNIDIVVFVPTLIYGQLKEFIQFEKKKNKSRAKF